MSEKNSWTLEGFLGKQEYAKEGTDKNGNPWMRQALSVFAGKDKETGKAKYEYISFFVPRDDIPTFRNFPEGTILELRGKPQANAYIDKEGTLQKSVQIQLDWENSWTVIKNRQQEENLPGLEDEHSSEPF